MIFFLGIKKKIYISILHRIEGIYLIYNIKIRIFVKKNKAIKLILGGI
ncbi:MAG: hypothetical protein K0R09_2342, partial [Clostridiales bacterium]|nr:hypothetical protein [Clostridiales bacterium]